MERIAYPIEREITAGWLDWLVETGYTGIYLEPDPRPTRRAGSLAQFHTQYRLIFLYDLAWGDDRELLRAYVREACRLAHARGLTVYLGIWEPRLPLEAWALTPPEWRGRGGYDNQPTSWCLGLPEARAGFEAMLAEAFTAIAGPDGIDGLKIGSHDSFAHLCSTDCPRCRDRSEPAQMADLFRSLLAAAVRSGLDRPGFDYVLYTWWWREGCLEAVGEVMAGRRVSVLGRSSQGLPQSFEGEPLGTTFDISLGLRGTGDKFVQLCREAPARGWSVLDMVPFGHDFEHFWQPCTPAPNRVAERIVSLRELGVAGWFDYDCGGLYPGINAEVVREDAHAPAADAVELAAATVARLFPPAHRAGAQAAYRLAEEALVTRPIGYCPSSVSLLSGRNWLELAIAMPFDPGDVTGFDQRHRIMWFAPANMLTHETVPVLARMYNAGAALWEQARAAFEALEPVAAWAGDFAWECRVVRAHELIARSTARYVRMAANRFARGAGRLSEAEERQSLLGLLTAELADAEAFAELWRADRRLLRNTLFDLGEVVRTSLPWYPVDPADPFAAKLAHTRRRLAELGSG